MNYDVAILGGSFAGMSAAMILARARRSVALLDTSTPRNRFAAASHGFPGQDGRSPAEIGDELRRQLSAYSTVDFHNVAASSAIKDAGGFVITMADGKVINARMIVLAYGVRDILPDLPGLKQRWGVSVLHCPYCHGYELNRQPIGVLASSELVMHQAMLLPDWGATTLFTQQAIVPTPEQLETLSARNVRIEETPVAELIGAGSSLEAVRLADGRQIPLAGLFVAPQTVPSSNIGEQLGCATKDGPTGPYISVDMMQITSVPGVFAAGDVASPMANATLAAAAGVMAGSAAHRSLIFDADLALSA